MIDELVKLANAMGKASIKVKDWHPKLKVLPKVSNRNPCIRVWLTADGRVKTVESISSDLAAQLRKYEPDNGRSLPGLNVRPLYRLVRPDDESKRIVKEIEASLKKGDFDWAPFTHEEDDFWEKTRDGLERCFGSVLENLENTCGAGLKEGETLKKFFEAVKNIDVAQFQTEYASAVKSKIENGELPLSLMCYFVNSAKKQKEDNDSKVPVPKFSIFLDIADYENYPVSHPKTIERLNELLVDRDDTETSSVSDTKEKDAYGLDAAQKEDKFPSVTLSSLGGVILRSQAKTILAQRRYHLCESDTFPVGAETRKRIKSALEWASDPERDGVTYGIAGDRELLFAYPRVLPEEKIALTKMLGAQLSNTYAKEETFKRLSELVIDQLSGLETSTGNNELEIFSLRKMDKARTKVVYYRNTTLASLDEAAQAWQAGCQNIPQLSIKDWSEKKEQENSYPVPVESETIFPIKLHGYMNIIWKQDGNQAGKVKSFTPTDGLKLLLENSETLVSYMLESFMQHGQGYFIALCRHAGRGLVAPLPDKKFYPGILGLLLFKSGKRKESYMKESAFLLGRFLRVSDEIHRLYCEVVRKNELPPELCGSSLLIGMQDAPAMAMSQLAMRAAPYVKWAKGGADKADKGKLVGYWLKQWEGIADQLHVLEWPKRMRHEERAEVFLGYLSSFPKKEQVINTDTSDIESKGE
ncbi:hypothetical protein LJC24_03045 [Desulfococcaceae bacterium OttesenSCG-928-F15]|nr:hypothetical protein [Desulfococcaceae bacterium OttesenSCG-928-F15]